MSNTSSPHGPSRGIDYRPSTPDQNRPTLSRSSSHAVAPKSEYLRNALQARRAQNTPTPSHQDIKLSPPPSQSSQDISTPKASPDVFDQFDLTEEQMTPVSPIRRRRPSDAGPPPSKTNRELTTEIEKLRKILIDTNLRMELFKKGNNELQHNLTAAKEEVKRLEPLEHQNYELHTENKQLRIKLEKMDEEISNLQETNEKYRRTNEELTAIASESAAHWSDHESAIEEAAECIIKMEGEKDLLYQELKQLKERVMAIESHSPASTLVNSPAKFPLRVYSVDESRPSTSHFDSDYYSQPESPQAKSSSTSNKSFTPSERSRKFLDLTDERRRSARDLVQRMSAVSLKALRDASLSPTPEVPKIPAAYQQQIPFIVADDRSATPSRRRVRDRQVDQVRPLSLMDAADISPARPHTCAPQAPEPQPEGLRGLYRPRRTSSRASTDRRPSSTHFSSSTITPASFAARQQSVREASPPIPSRTSSRHRDTERSNEHPHRHTPRHRSSSTDVRPSHQTPQSDRQPISSGWEPTSPDPHYSPASNASNASTLDLTSEVDPRKAKDQWWRNLDRLTHSQAMAQLQQQQNQPQQTPHHFDIRSACAAPAHPVNISRSSSTATARPMRSSSTTGHRRGSRATPTPSSALHSHPVERDILFNAKESEQDFMGKMARSTGSLRDSRGVSPFPLR
jgi:hypothetical protein